MIAAKTTSNLESAPGNCQLCGCTELSKFEIVDQTTLWVCDRCELYQYGKVADSYAYEDQYHAGYRNFDSRKTRTAMVRLSRAESLLNPGRDTTRLLDVGCSIGCTLKAAEKMGWQATGVDVSSDAVEICKQQNLDAVKTNSLALPFDDETFDIVVSWHVVEHVESVEETLAEWQRVLKPGGLMVLETPDSSSPKVKRRGASYRRFWAAEHTYTFAPDHLAKFMERAGMKILPTPFVGNAIQHGLSIASYALVYQSCVKFREAMGQHKAFQIFARKAG